MVRSLFVKRDSCRISSIFYFLGASTLTDELPLLHLGLKFLTGEVIREECVAIERDKIVLLPNFLLLLATETKAASKSKSAQVLYLDIED